MTTGKAAFLRSEHGMYPATGREPQSRPASDAVAAAGRLAGTVRIKVRRSEIEAAIAAMRRGDGGLGRLISAAGAAPASASPIVEALTSFAGAVRQPVYAMAPNGDKSAPRVDTQVRKRGLGAYEMLLKGFGGDEKIYRGVVIDQTAVDASIAAMPIANRLEAARIWKNAKHVSDVRDFGRKEVYLRKDGPDLREQPAGKTARATVWSR